VVPHHPARRDAAAERDVRVDAHARPDELVLRVLTCAGCSLLPSIGSAGPQQRVRRAHERGASSAADEEAAKKARGWAGTFGAGESEERAVRAGELEEETENEPGLEQLH
jgi:hypothetical protein